METTRMGGRGPDSRELALRRNASAVLEALAFEPKLERILDELRDAQAWAAEQGLTPAAPTFGRIMTAAEQVHRGMVFWDREPLEATPAPLEVGR